MASASVLAKMAVEISANNAKFGAALAKSQRDLDKFTKGITSMAKTLGVAFGASQVASFALEVSRLAGEAEGVRVAFNKLPSSIKLLEDMKRATGGTVSELDLMKRTMQAHNFGIELQALPELLQFASVRAQQTGQSVDYLVDSIVLGLGRKSIKILDNLGISATELRDRLGGISTESATIAQVTRAVQGIVKDSFETMGTGIETNATRLERLNASWVNFKVAIGDAANGTGVLGQSVDALSTAMDNLSSKHLSTWEKLLSLMSGSGATTALLLNMARQTEEQNRQIRIQETVVKNVDRAWKEFNGDIKAFEKAIAPNHPLRGQFLEEFRKRMRDADKATEDNKRTLTRLKKEKESLLAVFSDTEIASRTELESTAARIRAINAEIEAIESLLKERKKLKNDFSKFQKPDPFTSRMGEPDIDGQLGFQRERDLGSLLTRDEIEGPLDFIVPEVPFDRDLQGSILAEPGRLAKLREEMMLLTDTATTMGEAVGDAFVAATQGPEEFAKSLARMTGQIVELYLRQSIAAMITKSIANGGPLPFASIALAAAGIGAVRALFSQIGAGGGAGGGNASGVSMGRRPSEMGSRSVVFEGRISGYNINLISQKDAYRRGVVG